MCASNREAANVVWGAKKRKQRRSQQRTEVEEVALGRSREITHSVSGWDRLPVDDRWRERIDRVDWEAFTERFRRGQEAVNGPARGLRGRLLALRSGLDEASEAASELHSDLCYSAIEVHSAAAAALPFLVETLDEAPVVLTEHILDIILGLALATKWDRELPDWVSDIRAQVRRLEPRLRVLVSHPDSDVPILAGYALRALDDADTFPQPYDDG
jgi:hypothetical protein